MRLALTLAAALLATPTLADEVWTSQMGDIVYETEDNGAAILSFTNLDGYPARLFIPGLAGNYSNRGIHEAFWLGEGAGTCPVFMTAPGEGFGTTDWGRATVSFDKPGFPSSLTITLGWCFEEPREAFRGNTTAN